MPSSIRRLPGAVERRRGLASERPGPTLPSGVRSIVQEETSCLTQLPRKTPSTRVADPELPDNARFILTRALNRLDHELRGELVTRPAVDPTQTRLAP